MSDYHREYADQADARIRELEDKLAGAVEVLNGAGVKMCELIDQLAAYKVAVGKMGNALWRVSMNYAELHGGGIAEELAMEWMPEEVVANPICKAAIDAATPEQARIAREMESKPLEPDIARHDGDFMELDEGAD